MDDSTPLCRLCGSKHYNLMACKPVNVPQTSVGTLTTTAPSTLTKQVKWNRSNKDKYNAYMRDYMRKKREGSGEARITARA